MSGRDPEPRNVAEARLTALVFDAYREGWVAGTGFEPSCREWESSRARAALIKELEPRP